jgi:deoxyribodipyrimidine photolyase-related protein
MKLGIVFPHQLFESSQLLDQCELIYLVEEYLFFNQYNFHKQKLAFHRASMKFYESYLSSIGKQVVYIDAISSLSNIHTLIDSLELSDSSELLYVDPFDNWLENRLQSACRKRKLNSTKLISSSFINTEEELLNFFAFKKRMFQTEFYKAERLKRSILLTQSGTPLGGKWSFDDENRLKYPKGKNPPKVSSLVMNSFYKEAQDYVEKHFSKNYGVVNSQFLFPTTFEESKQWLYDFFEQRFFDFGPFEDAIVSDEIVLHHSMLTPMLNIGLITPQFVLQEALSFGLEHGVPLNSLEGFVRQILGWREFIRAVYVIKGSEMRTRNFWGFERKIPVSFWTGTTGIQPIDQTIQKILKTGYCHHIERLMVLGNFMLLCEFDPDDVYRWFMEMFIDSYDWVMVPNVYGMSQFADGGMMSTKPYISGSNYLMKMSDFQKGSWQAVWDGLFWHFMNKQRHFFTQNPRLGMLIRTFDGMELSKRNTHLEQAKKFLEKLNQSND